MKLGTLYLCVCVCFSYSGLFVVANEAWSSWRLIEVGLL